MLHEKMRWATPADYEGLFMIGLDTKKLHQARFIAYEYLSGLFDIYKCDTDIKQIDLSQIERITIEMADEMSEADFADKKIIIY